MERWEVHTSEGLGSFIIIVNRKTNADLDIIPGQKTAYLNDGARRSTGDLYQMIRDVAEHRVESLGEQTIDGRRLTGFSGLMKETQRDGTISLVPVRVWVDPKTNLPARLEHIDTTTGKVAGA